MGVGVSRVAQEKGEPKARLEARNGLQMQDLALPLDFPCPAARKISPNNLTGAKSPPILWAQEKARPGQGGIETGAGTLKGPAMIAHSFRRLSLADLSSWISNAKSFLSVLPDGADRDELQRNLDAAKAELRRRADSLPPVVLGRLPESVTEGGA
jgi:hypothetical protein